MLGGWGEILGSVLMLGAVLGLVVGNRALVVWASTPRMFAPAPRVGFVLIAGGIRVTCLAALAGAVMLLPPT